MGLDLVFEILNRFNLNEIGLILLMLIFLVSYMKYAEAYKILYYLKTNYSYVYLEVDGQNMEIFKLFTSGKFIITNFKLLFTKKFQEDEYLIKKINLFRFICNFRSALILGLLYILLKLEILVITSF